MKAKGLDSTALHVLAMALMLCDHVWATLLPGWEWLTCVGRICFPIYAFLLAEGAIHTKNRAKYALRLGIFALLAEIPFNLMTTDMPIFPFHQNVLWTLLLGLGMIAINEKIPAKWYFRVPAGVVTSALGWLLGTLLMTDYGGAGVLMILLFYFLRKRTWWSLLLQVAGLWYISTELISGKYYEIGKFHLYQQAFCLLALIPIWLYSGRKGHDSKAFRWFCYAFYPAHMLLLFVIRTIIIL